jgi:hypothetical protein
MAQPGRPWERRGPDPWNDPEAKAWVARTHEKLIPMIDKSAYVMSLVPNDGEADVKFAVELGFCIMMNKPILAIARPGTVISPKLAKVADKIIFVDVETKEGRRQLTEEFDAFRKEFGPQDE